MKTQKTTFKQTEIGLVPEEWVEVVLSDAIEINPQRKLKKGELAKFVSMADINPFQRKISNFTIKEFKGGSKFQNGDTLFARITPCLENGKTCFVDILDDKEVAFGSTEFIVLSAKEGKTVPLFVYYLSRSPEVRNSAIKSMSGTSGRQRVESEVFDTIFINLPPLPEQRAIAKILSDLDARIELKQQMNKTLEAIGQALFKHWFVDFEFPNEEGKPYKSSGGRMVYSEELGKEIPEGWRVGRLGEFISFEKGRKPTHVFDFYQDGLLPQILIEVLDGGSCGFANIENMIISNENDIIMVMDGASSGRCARGFGGILGSTLAKIVIKDLSQNYVYYFLKERENDIKENTTGTSIPHADKGRIEKYQIIIPSQDILNKFNHIIDNLFLRQILARKQSLTLSRIRDALLPKLMSGKIRVPVDEMVNGENL